MNKHKDGKDVISSIITLRHVKSGAKLEFCSGKLVSTMNNIVQEVKFKHGRIQICLFNNIVYDIEPWKGTRLT